MLLLLLSLLLLLFSLLLLIGGEAVLEGSRGAEHYFTSAGGDKRQVDLRLRMDGVSLYTANTAVDSREDIIFWKLLGGTSTAEQQQTVCHAMSPALLPSFLLHGSDWTFSCCLDLSVCLSL